MLSLFKKSFRFFLDIFQTFVIALAIFAILYQLAGQPHMVNGTSMVPNFNHKEYLLTEKISYYFSKPKRGDVIVFIYPKDQDLHYIKRIIGLPKETIRLENGQVLINGKILNESYLPPDVHTWGSAAIPNNEDFKIPPDHYVLLGDNREGSSDSRSWGTVHKKLIIGKAFFRYWPLNRLSFVKHAEYK